MARSYALRGLIAAVALGATGAQAQTDLNAGMSPAQLFSANCSACHRSPQGLSRGRDPSTVAYFLRDHYTTRPAIAAALAGFLASMRGAPPRPPTTSQGSAGAEQVGSAAVPARTPPARPIEKLAHATVERLKSFANDADAAKPSGDGAERGVARLQSYAGAGVAVNSLREAALAAGSRLAHPNAPEQGLRPSRAAAPPAEGSVAKGDTDAPTNATPAPSSAAPTAVAPDSASLLRGPPPSAATPTPQSNEDGR